MADRPEDVSAAQTRLDPGQTAQAARQADIARGARHSRDHDSERTRRARSLAERIDQKRAETHPVRRSDSSAETVQPASKVTLMPLDKRTMRHRFHGIDDDHGPDLACGQRSITWDGHSPRFELGDPIGKGGQGMVYAVADRDTRRVVALKCMRGHRHSPQHIARFVHEAQVTAQLEHPGVVPVHDLNCLPDGTLYYTMKRIEGRSLEAIIKQRHEHATYDLLQMFLRICQTMHFAHSRGVIHRDLKPANIMVGEYGEVLVVDWGLSKVCGEAEITSMRVSEVGSGEGDGFQTLDGHAVGTPAYMSPEQAAGDQEQIGPPSDVFSLGVILYELLRGRSPYPSNDAREVMQFVVDDTWLRLSPGRDHIAPPLVAIVHRAMAYAPGERYPDAAALAADVDDYLAGRPVSVHRETLLERLLRNASRHRAAVQSGAWVAAVLGIVMLGSLLAWRWLDRADLERLRREAGALLLQQRWDEARNHYERIIGRDPTDQVAQQALRDDLLRRQELTRRRLQEDQVAEALAMKVEAASLRDGEPAELQRALRMLGEALGRLPQGGEVTLRQELLTLRDDIQARSAELRAAAERRRARKQLPSIDRLLADGDLRGAERVLGHVEQILPGDEQLRLRRERIDAAHRERAMTLQMRQVDDLLAKAERARAEGRLADARGYLKTAVEYTPGDREPERLAELLRARDEVVALERQAEEERRQRRQRASIEHLQRRIDESLAADDVLTARGLLQQLEGLPVANERLQAIERRLDDHQRQLLEERADELLGRARTVLTEIDDRQERVDAQRLEWRRLRLRLSELDAAQRRREFELERAVGDGEAAIAQQAGRVIALLHQARSLVDDYAPVRAALADYYAWRVRSSLRRGDSASVQADATDGRFYDDEGRYALLFAGQAALRNIDEHRNLLVTALVEGSDRILTRSDEHWRLAPGEALILPEGRYGLGDEQGQPRAVRLVRGEHEELRPLPTIAAPEGCAYVPAGQVYGADGSRRRLAGFFMGVHEVTNGAYLQFLNAVGRRVPEHLLLYPRDPDAPERSLWSRRGGGRYQLSLRDGGRDLDPDAPVTGISIADARAYAAWRARRDGLAWRLPSQDEWRLAAQGGDGRLYPWGDHPTLTHCYSAYNHDPTLDTVAYAVGSFAVDRSVQGVFDLAGSVAEFVDGSWAAQPGFAIFCGGSYADREPQRFASTSEGVIDERQVHPRIGFRLVCDAE